MSPNRHPTLFINKTEGLLIPESASLISLDVLDLYMSIPNDEAYWIIAQILAQRDYLSPLTHFLLDLLEFILKNNYFSFNKRFFMQIKGIAMGSARAPSITNLYITPLEKTKVLNLNNPFFVNIIFYKQYINDLFIIYRDETSLKVFMNWTNTIDPSIKFTSCVEQWEIPFLDTTVYNDDKSRLAFRPYKKTTDRNTYLHYRSFHPAHTQNNLPVGQFLRLKKNSSTVEHYNTESDILLQLSDRGYPQMRIRKAKTKADNMPRDTLLRDKQQKREKRYRLGY